MFVFVRRAVAVALMLAAPVLVTASGCGGGIASHSGYKSDKSKPWKKPKVLAFDERYEAKYEGELNYATFDRAKWLAIELPADGQLSIELEISPTPPGDDEDFDLAMEVYDPTEQVITTADLESEDAHELSKERKLFELTPGRYLIHLYLPRRIDRAEYELKLAFVPGAPAAQLASAIAFPPRLPAVPLEDDTPASSRPKPRKDPKPRPGGSKPPKPRPDPVDPPSTSGPVSARVMNVNVVSGGTQITINRGTDNGLAAGMSGSVTGIKQGSFTLASCTTRSCKAVVKATPDEVNRSGKAVVRP